MHPKEEERECPPPPSPRDRRRQADGVRLQGRRRGRARPSTRAGRHRRQARATTGPSPRRAADAGRTGRAHRHRRAVRARMARTPRRPADTSSTTRRRPLHAAARAGGGADRRGQPGVPARLLPDRVGTVLDRRGSPRLSHRRRRRLARARPDVHEGCERFFRPGYNANLLDELAAGARGVVEKLERGAKVADVGCGHGASTILMAQAFPKSTFVGFDYHGGSIATARQRAAEAGLSRADPLRGGPGRGVPGARVRPGDDVRLPARHGRPGRRGRARADSSPPTAPG